MGETWWHLVEPWIQLYLKPVIPPHSSLLAQAGLCWFLSLVIKPALIQKWECKNNRLQNVELSELKWNFSGYPMVLGWKVGNPCYLISSQLVKWSILSWDLGHASIIDGDFRDTLGRCLDIGVCWPLLKIFSKVLQFSFLLCWQNQNCTQLFRVAFSAHG